MNTQSKTPQHTRITMEEAKDLHQSGQLTTSGLVLMFFRIRLADNWVGKFRNKEIYEFLGISESSFYRAVSQLRTAGRLYWKTNEVTQYALNPEVLYEKRLELSHSQPSLTLGSTTVKSDSQPPKSDSGTCKSDSDSPKSDSETCKSDSGSPKSGGTTPPKPSQGEGSGTPSDLFQIYFNSLSPSFQALGVGEDVGIDFLKWVVAESQKFREPIRDVVAWLSSTDSRTGRPRLETQFLMWQNRPKNAPPGRDYSAEWEKVLGWSARISYGQSVRDFTDDQRIIDSVQNAGGLTSIGRAERDELTKKKAAFLTHLKHLDSQSNQ